MPTVRGWPPTLRRWSGGSRAGNCGPFAGRRRRHEAASRRSAKSGPLASVSWPSGAAGLFRGRRAAAQAMRLASRSDRAQWRCAGSGAAAVAAGVSFAAAVSRSSAGASPAAAPAVGSCEIGRRWRRRHSSRGLRRTGVAQRAPRRQSRWTDSAWAGSRRRVACRRADCAGSRRAGRTAAHSSTSSRVRSPRLPAASADLACRPVPALARATAAPAGAANPSPTRSIAPAGGVGGGSGGAVVPCCVAGRRACA